ncbi:B12-binding domain-containing protein [Rufibacter sp. LB8]|uniref:cobalamin B12-binding domain-containing protein n=1 Tax=Rufibacter sp. LB8 TaxID=2777781 RepID=UPI00178C3FF6|nr:cobalamin-dependent protein [Rufibacter sp. LB8]
MGEIRKKAAATLKRLSTRLAADTTKLVYQRHPDLEARYGAIGREKCHEDALYHLSFLIEAVSANSMVLFSDYVTWAQQVLESRQIAVQDLHHHLVILKEVVAQHLPIDQYVLVANHLNAAVQQLAEKNNLPVEEPAPLTPLAETYLELLLSGSRKKATDHILDQISAGVDIKQIYLDIFEPVQHRVGHLWQTNKISVAQEHFCTAVTQSVMSQLYPYIFGNERNGYRLIATCVSGDLHEVGIRMVSDFFEMEGWDTYYLGANVPVASLLQTVRQQKPDLLLLSATMTFHIQLVARMIAALRETEEFSYLKIMVGGRPFNVVPDLWKEIGADGYSQNAQEALAMALHLVTKKE